MVIVEKQRAERIAILRLAGSIDLVRMMALREAIIRSVAVRARHGLALVRQFLRYFSPQGCQRQHRERGEAVCLMWFGRGPANDARCHESRSCDTTRARRGSALDGSA